MTLYGLGVMDTLVSPDIHQDDDQQDIRGKLRFDLVVASVAVAVVCLAALIATSTTQPSHAKGPAPVVSLEVGAALSEWRVELSRTTLAPGRYTFRIANAGTVQHELIAFKLTSAGAVIPLDAKNDVNEEAPSLENVTDGDNIDPGKQQTRTIDLATPGTYMFMCNIPGHYRLGMHTIVTAK